MLVLRFIHMYLSSFGQHPLTTKEPYLNGPNFLSIPDARATTPTKANLAYSITSNNSLVNSLVINCHLNLMVQMNDKATWLHAYMHVHEWKT